MPVFVCKATGMEMTVVRHEAMAAEFRICIVHDDRLYARQAAQAAFADLDLIEGELSRFIENSDISRINSSKQRRSLIVGLDTFDCLSRALELEQITGGLFNIAYDSVSPCRANDAIELARKPPTVRVRIVGTRLDLGGIGKGFALDRIGSLLKQWDISCFKLQASVSTVLVGDPPPGKKGWSMSLVTGERRRSIRIANHALSGSGVAVKGEHIIDPRTRRPAKVRQLVWASAPTGAMADAMSTTFMIMNDAQIAAFCHRHAEVTAFVEDPVTGPPQRHKTAPDRQ